MANIQIQDVRNICCIGATKVGVLSTLVAAEKWPQKKFVIVDKQETIDSWMGDKGLQCSEPGLSQLLSSQNQVNVHFETPNYDDQVNLADMVVIAVDVKWDLVLREVLFVAQQPKVIVIKSHLSADDDALTALNNIISDIHPSKPVAIQHHIFWVPELFSDGTALQSLRQPKRVLIAPCHPLNNPNTGVISDFYLAAPTGWVLNISDIMIMSASSAILGVMGSNVMVAMEATVMNFLSEMCEELPDCDIDGLNGNWNLRARAGFADPALLRDVASCAHLAEVRNMKAAAQILKSIIKCNTKQQNNCIMKRRKKRSLATL